MIYGDPDKIAFHFDAVNSWNEEGSIWVNGIFSVYIEGVIVFHQVPGELIPNVTLNIVYSFYREIIKCHEKKRGENLRSINMKREAKYIFKEIYDTFYAKGEGAEIEYFLDFTSEPFMDAGYNIFVFMTDESDIIIYGSIDNIDDIKYLSLPKDTVRKLIYDMNAYPLFSGKRVYWDDSFHYYARHEYIK